MDSINFIVGRDTILAAYQKIIDDFPGKTSDLVDELAELYRGYMVAEAPYIFGDMREGHVIESTGEFTRYVYSDVPYFDAVVNGHVVNGPIYSDKQRRWWFWYLRTVLGGDYSNKTDGFQQGNNYPERAYNNAQSSIDNKMQEYLSKIGSD